MNNGLKVFETLTNVYLQAEIIPQNVSTFKKQYAIKTKHSASENNFFNRKKGKTAWGNAYRIFFDTTEKWTIESLKKLGFHVTVESKGFSVCNKDIKTDNLVTNVNLFWKLVEYGYRLGANDNIPYDLHCLRRHLSENLDIPMFNIINHESENAIYEALLLAS